MKTNARFIKSIVNTAAKTQTEMPWQRGTRRADFIARRDTNAEPVRKSA